MSFDGKMGKIAKEGNRQQALGGKNQKSEVRSGVGWGKIKKNRRLVEFGR